MTQTPPGWYPDPQSPVRPILRYWDGTVWTPATSPMPFVAGPQTTPDGQVLAGWWWRVLAMVVDSLIVGAAALPLTLPIFIPFYRRLFDLVYSAQTGSPGVFPADLFDQEMAVISKVALISFAVTVAYNVVFLRWKSATPGKLAVGLRVRLRESPGRLPWRAIWLRVLVQFGNQLFFIIPLLGYFLGLWAYLDDLWPLWDGKKQALHEKLAGTNVVVHDGRAG